MSLCKNCEFWNVDSWKCNNGKTGNWNGTTFIEDYRDAETDDMILAEDQFPVNLYTGPLYGCVNFKGASNECNV